MSTLTHFRPHADFAAELAAHNERMEAARTYRPQTETRHEQDNPSLQKPEMGEDQAGEKAEAVEGEKATPESRKLYKGDRVIVPGGWDGIVEAIDVQAVYVLMDSGPVRGLTDFQRDELEFWSHGQ